MTSNRVSLAQALNMPVSEVSNLPIQQIAILLEDLAALKQQAAIAGNHLFAALDMRFAEPAKLACKAKNKDTGTVRLDHDDAVVICDLPKKVEYDQAKLQQAVATLQMEWGENPSEYVQIEIKVPESKYNAWPSKIRELFEPARTVGTGKPTYKIELKDVA